MPGFEFRRLLVVLAGARFGILPGRFLGVGFGSVSGWLASEPHQVVVRLVDALHLRLGSLL